MATLFLYHWQVEALTLVAVTRRVRAAPGLKAPPSGCCVITGGPLTTTSAASLVTLPTTFETATV